MKQPPYHYHVVVRNVIPPDHLTNPSPELLEEYHECYRTLRNARDMQTCKVNTFREDVTTNRNGRPRKMWNVKPAYLTFGGYYMTHTQAALRIGAPNIRVEIFIRRVMQDACREPAWND
jgi:hypothetical protein